MTDRIKGFVVTLESDIREDDAESIKNAIRALRGVIGVEGSVVGMDDLMNRTRIRLELAGKLWKVLEENK